MQWIATTQGNLPQGLDVLLKQLHYEPGSVQLLGEVPSYEDLNRLQTALATASGVAKVVIESAQILSSNKRVQFRLRLE